MEAKQHALRVTSMYLVSLMRIFIAIAWMLLPTHSFHSISSPIEPWFKKLPEMSEEEEDMLDLAAGLKDNSRLGCQIIASAELDGLEVVMPAEVNNMLK